MYLLEYIEWHYYVLKFLISKIKKKCSEFSHFSHKNFFEKKFISVHPIKLINFRQKNFFGIIDCFFPNLKGQDWGVFKAFSGLSSLASLARFACVYSSLQSSWTSSSRALVKETFKNFSQARRSQSPNKWEKVNILWLFAAFIEDFRKLSVFEEFKVTGCHKLS